MNKQVEHFNQRDRRRLGSGLWPATSLKGVSGLLLIKMLRNKNFIAYRACWRVPFITPRLPGSRREGVLCVLSSAFRNMNSMAKIVPNFWVKRLNSVFRAGVFKEIHTVIMLTFGFSHAGGSPADMDAEVGQNQSISFPSPYTGMSYQE